VTFYRFFAVMKKLLLLLSLTAIGSIAHPADTELLQQQATDVYNLKLGETNQPISVAGLSVLDQLGARNVIALGDVSTLQTTGVQFSGVLFAILPPDGNLVSALVMYQAAPSGQQPETDQSLNNLVHDIVAHNGWTDCQILVRAMNAGETLPQATQFWIGSSSQSLTLNGPTVCVADSATAP
jgi:hypothetical protein